MSQPTTMTNVLPLILSVLLGAVCLMYGECNNDFISSDRSEIKSFIEN